MSSSLADRNVEVWLLLITLGSRSIMLLKAYVTATCVKMVMNTKGLRGKRLQLALAFTGAIAWILQGYDQALMNGLLTLPSFYKQFPAIDTSTAELMTRNSTLQGTTVALYELGAAIGAVSCYWIGNIFGKKRPVIAAAIIILIGVLLQTTAFQLAQLIISRIVTGVGVGMFTATLPSWVAESSDASHRGWLIMLEGSGALFGLMFVSWLELGFYFVPGENQVSWRFPIAFQAVIPITVLCIIPFLAESPRWLFAKDRISEGTAVLARLEDEAEDSEVVAARAKIILDSIYEDEKGQSSNPFARTSNKQLHRTLLAIAVNVLGQMSGVNVISFYSNEIFERDLGYSATLSRIISGSLQTWQFLMGTLAVLLVDRFGRRSLLLAGAIGMCIAHAGLAGLSSHSSNPTAAGCSLIFDFLAFASYPIGLFLLPFMYASEIAPNRVRPHITAMSSGSNWLFNFLVAEVTPVGFASIGWKYYLVYVCTNALSIVVFYLFVPETKGRTLEDIDAIFIQSRNPLQARRVAKKITPGVAERQDMSGKATVLDDEFKDLKESVDHDRRVLEL